MQFQLPRLSSALVAALVVVAACGGTTPSARLTRLEADPLAYVPVDAVAIFHVDLVRFHQATEIFAMFARANPRLAADSAFWRCDSFLVAVGRTGVARTGILACPGIGPTEFERLLAASADSESRFVAVGPGIAVRLEGGAEMPVAVRRSGPVAQALREQRAESHAFASLAFVPDDALRAAFVASSEDPSARAILEPLVSSFLGLDAWFVANGPRIRAHLVGRTSEVVAARMLAAMFQALAAPAGPVDGEQEVARLFLSAFEFRVDGTSSVGDANIEDVAGFFTGIQSAMRAERSRRDEEAARASLAALPAAQRETGASAPSPSDEAYAALRRFEYSEVIASIESRRASLRPDVAVDDVHLLLALGEAYTATGRAEEALAIYQWADSSELPAGDTPVAAFRWRVRFLAGRARNTRGDLVGAIAELDRALAVAQQFRAPENVVRDTYFERAFVLARAGRGDEAHVDLRATPGDPSIAELTPERAVEADEEFYLVWISLQNNLAWADYLAGRYAEGIARMEALFRAVATRPRRGGVRASYENTLGCLLLASGRFEEASAAFQRDLALRGRTTHENDPARANTLVLLATSELRLHHIDKAIQYARRGLALFERTRTDRHPETALARLRLAQALRESGDAAGSRAEAQRAVESFRAGVEPTHPDRREAEAFLAAAR